MLQHNLLLIYRNFKLFKGSFFINLIGLSSGLACTLLIYLWVRDEVGVDKFHEKDSQLYQVMQHTPSADGVTSLEYTPGVLAQALAEEMPEVEYSVTDRPHLDSDKGGILSFGDTHIKANQYYVSEDYFNVFSYQLIHGDKQGVLKDKNSVAISDELAKKLFNTTENIVGKAVEWNNKDYNGQYIISGIFQKLPVNSTTQFDLLFNYQLYLEKNPHAKEWSNSFLRTFLVLKKGTDVEAFNDKIKNFVKSKYNDSKASLSIQRYSEKYLYGHYTTGTLEQGGRIAYVRLFSVIALAILFIACINFINLSTAKTSRRLKEVGIKKAIGANRKMLIYQYLTESVLMAFLALIMAVGIVFLLIPGFNELTGKQLLLTFEPNLMLAFISITIFTGVISGSYPAFYLSGFNPVTVLKGKLPTSAGEVLVRKGLVIFQFTVSVILIISVVVIYKQIEFIGSKNLGYNRHNVVVFQMAKVNDAFMAELKNVPGVINASKSYSDFKGWHGIVNHVSWEGKPQEDHTEFAGLYVGYDFIETMGIEMAAGQTFSRELNPESQIILNETAIQKMGIKDPIGKTIKAHGEKQIVGIVKDFNFETLYEKVKPTFFNLVMEDLPMNVFVKIQSGAERETIDKLTNFYDRYTAGLPFEYKFMDEEYQALYVSERRISVLSQYFAGIAILIACLGLYGLASFTAERRRKEIGIRKVLGSSEMGIIYLLSSDFTRLVFVAVLLALPISYLISRYWLGSFAYSIALEPWYFIGSGLLALLISWLTVGMQAIKAARINPIQILRDE